LSAEISTGGGIQTKLKVIAILTLITLSALTVTGLAAYNSSMNNRHNQMNMNGNCEGEDHASMMNMDMEEMNTHMEQMHNDMGQMMNENHMEQNQTGHGCH